MNIVNILLQNISFFMKNVRLRTFFPDFALLVEGHKNPKKTKLTKQLKKVVTYLIFYKILPRLKI